MIDTEQSKSEAALPRFTLSIVIPVYNGAASITELVRAIEDLSIEGGHEIVLVEDGSPDQSLEICGVLVENARVPITLVGLARNYGEHNAVLAGLRHAGGAHVITMDDDLQNPPGEIERLLTFAQHSGHQVIYTYYDEKQHPAWRNLGSRFTDRVANFALEKPKGLYLSSFRCMSAFVVCEISRYEGPFPYIDGLRVEHLPRTAGRSNYTMRRLIRLWMSMFVNFSVIPLQISTIAGFVFSGIGAIGGAMAIGEALLYSPPAGWASLIAAVLLLSGVQLIMLGIIGEYLGRLYLSANGKPQSIIKEVRRSNSFASGAQADLPERA